MQVGDRVFYVLESGPGAGKVRPAVIVEVIDPGVGLVDLQVFTAGPKDGLMNPTVEGRESASVAHNVLCRLAVKYSMDRGKGTWHALLVV